MLYYSKITANNPKETAHALFLSCGADEDSIILDESLAQKSPENTFCKLKSHLENTHDGLIIDSLHSLGKNNREISKELQWFQQNNVPLIVLDIPSTAQGSVHPMQLLAEIYSNLAATEIHNVKEKQRIGINRRREQNAPLGRKRIPYPANWEEAYARWERKEISVGEFMELTGLKKGTLYNLIKQYKENTAIAKNA